MKRIKPSVLFLFLLLCFSLKSFSQDLNTETKQTGLKKNVIYLSMGYAPLWAALNINYERMVYENRSWFFNSYYAKISGGYFATWGFSGPNFNTGLTVLGGKKNNHLEINGGIAVIKDDWDGDVEVYPGGALGYRFQKPGGKFVFRTGIGYPESFYLSFGFGF